MELMNVAMGEDELESTGNGRRLHAENDEHVINKCLLLPEILAMEEDELESIANGRRLHAENDEHVINKCLLLPEILAMEENELESIDNGRRLHAENDEHVINKCLLLPEILATIFQHLSVQDKGRAARVCRIWRDASAHYQILIWQDTTVELRSRRPIPWSNLGKLRIRGLRVHEPDYGVDRWRLSDVVNGIANLQYLWSLDLSAYTTASTSILTHAFLVQLYGLAELNLTGCEQVTDKIVSLVSVNMPNLIALDVSYCSRLTDFALLFVATCLTQLLRLRLSACHRITDVGIGYLCGITRRHSHAVAIHNLAALESLSLDLCSSLTNRSLRYLSAGQPSLRNLDLGYNRKLPTVYKREDRSCLIDDDGLKLLVSGRRMSLTSLSLFGCNLVTSEGISYVARLYDLKKLNLSFCSSVSDDAFIHLLDLKLETLILKCCVGITDEAMRNFPHFRSLRKLKINDCPRITEIGLAHLTVFGPSMIASLDVSGANLCGRFTLFQLARGLSYLRRLTLDRCQINEDGLDFAYNSRWLHELVVVGINGTRKIVGLDNLPNSEK